jgi:hypothetical protein
LLHSNFFILSFLSKKEHVSEESLLCNVSTRIVVVGDLKFYAQLLGTENMSSSWCMWCTLHPSEWKHHPLPPSDLQKDKNHKECIDRKEVKEAREILGIVNYPVWDFIQPENFMFPELHAEIGLVNNVLDKFYSFIDDQVEAITPEEATA